MKKSESLGMIHFVVFINKIWTVYSYHIVHPSNQRWAKFRCRVNFGQFPNGTETISGWNFFQKWPMMIKIFRNCWERPKRNGVLNSVPFSCLCQVYFRSKNRWIKMLHSHKWPRDKNSEPFWRVMGPMIRKEAYVIFRIRFRERLCLLSEWIRFTTGCYSLLHGRLHQEQQRGQKPHLRDREAWRRQVRMALQVVRQRSARGRQRR